MRRMLFAWAMLGLAAAGPLSARGDDQEIARQVVARLKAEKAAGHLQGSNIDLKVEGGVVYLKGSVVSAEQETLVLETARLTPGVTQVRKKIRVDGAAAAPAPQAMQPARVSPPSGESAPASRSSRRLSAEESALQLLTGPATPQAISLTPPAPPAAPASPSPMAATEARDELLSQQIGTKLKQEVNAGRLDGGTLAFKVENGVVWFRGSVSTPEQEQLALLTAQTTPGVSKIMKDIRIQPVQPAIPTASANPTQTVQATAVQPPQGNPPATAATQAGLQKAEPAQPQLVPVNPYYAYPYAGYYPAASQTPMPFAVAQPASAEMAAANAGAAAAGGMAPYCPTPMHPMGAFGGAGVRYDHPNLPAYAWPSYSAYPNYAAVQYPKQYSPTVWPYIGPFYPYPQVPLGWRKVVLEWDDGWWQLDFKDQSRPWKMR